MAIVIPHSLFQRFIRTNNQLRWGQEFHGFAKLEKLNDPEDVHWADKLYNEPDEYEAKGMVYAKIDYQQ